MLAAAHPASGQAKPKPKPKPQPKADTPAKPQMVIVYDTATGGSAKPTVVVPPKPKPQGNFMIVYDTAPPPKKLGMDVLPPPTRPPGTPPPSAPDTVRYARPGVPKPTPKTQPPVTIVREPPECACITMEPHTRDTLQYNTYMRYTMRMKNTCTTPVWVLSGGFAFVVLNMSGTKPRVIHKLSFVTRYQYPEFVLLEPGNTFDFSYADDPFFEYEMLQGLDYRIRFTYSNPKRTKPGSFRTLTCIKTADRVVHVE